MTPARIFGWLLLVFSAAPLHRLLTPARTGPAGTSTRASAEAAWVSGLLGATIVIVLAAVLTRTDSAVRLRDFASKAGAALDLPSGRSFALAVGAVAAVLGASTALLIHGGLPTSVDELAQLLHAQAVASGSLTLPVENATAAWSVQNGTFTDSGWASIYPPVHTLLLAGGLLVGVPWLVGPLAIGVATAAFAAGAEETLQDARLARASAVLLALSPFWILLGSTHLSHSTAAAAVALVFWASARARTGSLSAFLMLGGAVGLAVATRPWTGLALSTALVVVVTLPGLWRRRSSSKTVAQASAFLAGGTPFALLLFWWNNRLYGSPFELGYSAAFGPSHGLGLHVDPWGNMYGATEALAYSGADVVQLSAHLLETPLPALLLVGLALILGVGGRAVPALLAWAFAGIAANSMYWHHGVHMGPRMLFETVPAWIALTVIAGHGLATMSAAVPKWVRDGATWAVAISLIGSVLLAPNVVLMQRSGGGAASASTLVPSTAPTETALIFVHGSWSSRISARLATDGMRRDSIETALRRNDVCAVDAFSRVRMIEIGAVRDLEMEALPGSPPALTSRTLSPGNRVRVDPSLPVSATCMREARSDRFGAIELEGLLWQVPPLPDAQIVIARDMGPAGNAPVLTQYPQKTPYLYMDGPDGPRLLAYDVGMELAWGGPAAPTGGAAGS
jgi:hypothetical protein